MTDLLSRLQAASEGSAELDREVLLACGWQFRLVDEMLVTEYRWFDAAGHEHVGSTPRPTRSLDDLRSMVLALNMGWRIVEGGAMQSWVTVIDPSGEEHHGRHRDTILAAVLAFLRAGEGGR